MDMNFHYFTTNVLAKAVGYTENEAQTISAYCQLVNDFNKEKIKLENGITVPDFVEHLVYEAGDRFFYGIATHHQSLTIEELQQERYQRERLIPFHFPLQGAMPKNFYKSESDLRRKEYRTAPISLAKPSDYWKAISNIAVEPGNQTLIHKGILSHILGDSYGNQKFSGTNGWENCAWLWDAVDNVTQSNITADYKTFNVSVGHRFLGNAPDDCFLSYTMKQRSDPAEKQKSSYQNHYSRYNGRDFLKAAKVIYHFLLQGKTAVCDFETLEPKLLKAYLHHGSSFDAIKKNWAAEFPQETFTYDPYALSTLKKETSADFFHFQYLADRIRKKADPYFEYPFS